MKGWHVSPREDVNVIYTYGAWEVTATWPTRARRDEIISLIKVVHRGTDPGKLVLSTTRINLLSSSAKSSLVTAMNRVDKEQTNELVHSICDNLVEYFKASGRTSNPVPAKRTGDRWLIYPMWPSSGGTLVAGGTNTFKSFIGIAAAVQASTGVEIMSGNTRQPTRTKILYCDWEANQFDFAERLRAVLTGADMPLDPCVAYRQLRVPLRDAAETIADEIALQGYGGVVIDSLSAAIGGSLIDDELANLFWNAVSYLGVPALILAHKSSEAIRTKRKGAFGSVMHENRSRMLWDVSRDADAPSVAWEVVSDNNTGLKGNKLAWRIDVASVGEHEDKSLDAVSMTALNPLDVRVAVQTDRSSTRRADEIALALRDNGPLTSSEIAQLINVSPGSVRKVLSRHMSMFQRRADSRWQNVGVDSSNS